MKPASLGPCGDAGASIGSKAGAKMCATVAGRCLTHRLQHLTVNLVPQGFCLAFEAADEDKCATARVAILSVAKVYKQGAIFEVTTLVRPPLRFSCCTISVQFLLDMQYMPASSDEEKSSVLYRKTLAACSGTTVERNVRVWSVQPVPLDLPMLQREWAGPQQLEPLNK